MENFGEAETITEFRNRSCPGLRPRVGAEADAEVADEATALLAAREIGERLVERRGVPVRRAPLVVTGGKLCDEPLLPVSSPSLALSSFASARCPSSRQTAGSGFPGCSLLT